MSPQATPRTAHSLGRQRDGILDLVDSFHATDQQPPQQGAIQTSDDTADAFTGVTGVVTAVHGMKRDGRPTSVEAGDVVPESDAGTAMPSITFEQFAALRRQSGRPEGMQGSEDLLSMTSDLNVAEPSSWNGSACVHLTAPEVLDMQRSAHDLMDEARQAMRYRDAARWRDLRDALAARHAELLAAGSGTGTANPAGPGSGSGQGLKDAAAPDRNVAAGAPPQLRVSTIDPKRTNGTGTARATVPLAGL